MFGWQRVSHAVALASVLCVVAVHASLFAKKGPVRAVTPASFEAEVLAIEKPTFVAFTAPWCGHCKTLAPQYERAAKELDGIVKFTNVDCDDASAQGLCAKYGVRGFPTLKMFPATKKRLPRAYNGERTKQALVEYAVGSLPVNVIRRVSGPQLRDFLGTHGASPSVVLVSPKYVRPRATALTRRSSTTPTYRALALDFRGRVAFAFLYAGTDDVLAEAQRAIDADLTRDALPMLYLVKPEGAVRYTGTMKYRRIKAWIEGGGPGGARVAPAQPAPAADDAAEVPGEEESPPRTSSTYEELAREIADKVVGEQPKKSAEDSAAERETTERLRREVEMRKEAIRRSLAKAKARDDAPGAHAHVVEEPQMTEGMFMEQLRELMGPEAAQLADHAIKARRTAERIAAEDPSKEHVARAMADQEMIEGLNADIANIRLWLQAGANADGFRLTEADEEELRRKLKLLQGMASTVSLRMQAREKNRPVQEVAHDMLAHLEL
ncbi:protein disulfide-isomerase [Malassezia sp. CBS 17886]|nr:protein disulfide-isomerase [Malassezia sp. CBS 17886]